MMQPLIEVRNLVNRFGSHIVHDGLDFDIYPGEIVGVVGGNGTGKSVLLRTIVGLQKPVSGTITMAGQDVSKHKEKNLWGVLFQKGALFSNLTVIENIAFQLKEKTNLSPEDIRHLALMKIELVGLPVHAGNKYPSELSGGMTKRAALARALALDPRILFLDEPTAGLDAPAADGFDQLIRDLVDYLGLSVFMITHDLDSLSSICDRIAVLVDRKIKMGTLKEHLKDKHPWMQEYFHNKRARFMEKA
jgi:phospholipid/cholesterol/gamma-HCH transport system ATP-binding protein